MNALKLFLSAMIAGFATIFTSFLAVAQNSEVQLVNFSDISQMAWAIIVAGGVLVFLQNIQTYLKRPPERVAGMRSTEG